VVAGQGGEGILDRHIVPRWGDYYLDRITLSEVRTWFQGLSTRIGGRHLRNIYQLLKEIHEDACALYGLPMLPWKVVLRALPKIDNSHATSNRLGEKQLADALREACGWKELAPMLYVMATTAMRYTHAAALRWSDLDGDILKPARK